MSTFEVRWWWSICGSWRVIPLQTSLTRWAPCSVLQMNKSEAAYYRIPQQCGWWKIFIFPAVIISSPTPPFFLPSDSIYCSLLLDFKMLAHISRNQCRHLMVQLTNVLGFCLCVCVWDNSLQAWTKPWWGQRNDDDQHLCWESWSGCFQSD